MIDHNSLMCLESIAVFLPDKIVFKPDALVMMIVVFTWMIIMIREQWDMIRLGSMMSVLHMQTS
jgi:hypothetical protein